MKPTFRKSMIWLHTYTGLLGGWLMFAVFLSGTLSYYNTELTHWITGNRLANSDPISQQRIVNGATQWLQYHAKDASSWRISLPNERGYPLRVDYRSDGERYRAYLDPYSFEKEQRVETNGGNFFRTFHYTLSIRDWGGRYFTGIAAMLMLIGVFSGIYTHRRFFKDFFTLRQPKWQAYLKDLHAIFGVITIPFCFVICASALLIYINTYIPFAIDHYYEGSRGLNREVSTNFPSVKQHLADLTPDSENADDHQNTVKVIWPQLQQYWGQDTQVSSISIDSPGTHTSRWIVSAHSSENLSNKSPALAFNANGHPLSPMEPERLARKIRRIFYGLHEAHFATLVLRFVLFSLGLMSTLLIASGMVIWLQKRREKRPKSVHHITAKLNLGVLYGMSLGVAAYLLPSRLPWVTGGSDISELELQCFFITWAASIAVAIAMKERHFKPAILTLNMLAFLALLLLDMFSTKGHLLHAWFHWDWPYLSINFLIATSVIAFFIGADKASRERYYD